MNNANRYSQDEPFHLCKPDLGTYSVHSINRQLTKGFTRLLHHRKGINPSYSGAPK